MSYLISGFIFGLLIPYFARRMSKCVWGAAGYVLYRLIWPVKRVSKAKRKNNQTYLKLTRKYFMRSVGWGIVCSALSYGVSVCFDSFTAPWLTGFVWVLLLLYEIDERMLLLPDVLTVPLLIAGFTFAALGTALHPVADPVSPALLSALGAVAGYVLPVIASLFLVRRHPDAFGGGDIKMLAASGAWLGIGVVPYLILASTVVFALMMLAKRQRAGAFGPAIVIASLVLMFLGFYVTSGF